MEYSAAGNYIIGGSSVLKWVDLQDVLMKHPKEKGRCRVEQSSAHGINLWVCAHVCVCMCGMFQENEMQN